MEGNKENSIWETIKQWLKEKGLSFLEGLITGSIGITLIFNQNGCFNNYAESPSPPISKTDTIKNRPTPTIWDTTTDIIITEKGDSFQVKFWLLEGDYQWKIGDENTLIHSGEEADIVPEFKLLDVSNSNALIFVGMSSEEVGTLGIKREEERAEVRAHKLKDWFDISRNYKRDADYYTLNIGHHKIEKAVKTEGQRSAVVIGIKGRNYDSSKIRYIEAELRKGMQRDPDRFIIDISKYSLRDSFKLILSSGAFGT